MIHFEFSRNSRNSPPSYWFTYSIGHFSAILFALLDAEAACILVIFSFFSLKFSLKIPTYGAKLVAETWTATIDTI